MATVAVAVFLGLAATAAAQQATPRQPMTDRPVSAPMMLAPPGFEAPPAATAPTGPASPTGIEINRLQDVDSESVGTLVAGSGGFGVDLWADTDRAVVEILMRKLPAGSPTVAGNEVLRRLILSRARAPSTRTPAVETGESLLYRRLAILANRGRWADIEDLVRAVPGRDAESIARIEAETLLLANKLPRACGLIGRWAGRSADIFWHAAKTFCEAMAKETDKVMLSASLLREEGMNDPVFDRLLEALIAETPLEIDNWDGARPLHLAMARAVRTMAPPDMAIGATPWFVRALAVNPNLPMPLRIRAAEKAAQLGAFDTAELRNVYGDVDVGAAEGAKMLAAGEQTPAPLQRALIIQALARETVPAAALELMRQYLEAMRGLGYFAIAAPVVYDDLRQVRPRVDLTWFAPEAIRALIAAGNSAQAGAWMNLLNRASVLDPNAKTVFTGLAPLARIARVAGPAVRKAAQIEPWYAQEKQRDPEGADRRALLILTLFDALRIPVGTAQWHAVLEAAPATLSRAPLPSHVFALRDAAAGARVGESVMLLTILLGEDRLNQVDLMAVNGAVGALWALGLETEARRLAVETALAGGL